MLKGSLPEVFLDTDVAFDILSKRTPHYAGSIKLLELAAKDQISLQIAESIIFEENTLISANWINTLSPRDKVEGKTGFLATVEIKDHR